MRRGKGRQAGGRERRESKRKRYQVKTKFCSVSSSSLDAERGWMKCYIQLYDEGIEGRRKGGERERERDRKRLVSVHTSTAPLGEKSNYKDNRITITKITK